MVPNVELVRARQMALPTRADCNCPAHWVNDTVYVFTSHPWAGQPRRSSGPAIGYLPESREVAWDNEINGSRWFESTWRTDEGLYGWYHNEPSGVCPGSVTPSHVGELTSPRIGAAISSDEGLTWRDLGLVLTERPGVVDCTSDNGFFASGHGDFCVMLDQSGEWLYFFYGSYGGSLEEQGVAVARMRWADRDAPVGNVEKWFDGGWSEPGLEGRLTPTFAATIRWQQPDCNSFWGPSVHWNTHLGLYVMILNRTNGRGWVQEGTYVSFAGDLSNPRAWTEPTKILDGGSWYGQVLGTGEGETDKVAGRTARFFSYGISEYEIVFGR